MTIKPKTETCEFVTFGGSLVRVVLPHGVSEENHRELNRVIDFLNTPEGDILQKIIRDGVVKEISLEPAPKEEETKDE